MTILQFQQLYFIDQQPGIDIDRSIKKVGVITGLTPEQVDKMKLIKFNKLCAHIKSQFAILEQKLFHGHPKSIVYVNGRVYRLHYRIDRKPINAGRYVEVVTFGNDIVGNLHKLMASIAEPLKWSWKKFKFVPYERLHEDIATDFEKMNFEAAYHAAVFFYTLYRVSMEIMQPYLVNQLVRKGENRKNVDKILTNSLKILDGFTMPKWSLSLKEYALNRCGH